MLQLSRQSMTQSLSSQGYSPLDYLYLDEITKLLNQLNQQQFDPQTLQQLQNQCTTNSKGQIKLDDLIQLFIKAEAILLQRDSDIKKLMANLQKQMTDKLKTQNPNQTAALLQLEQQLYEAKEELISNNINLQIIRKPFVKKTMSPRTPRSAAYQSLTPKNFKSPSHLQYAAVSLPGEGLLNISNTQTFTWIFELSVLLLFISLPCMFYVPCYVNVLLLLMITLNMISGYFCRYILRVWMALILLTIAIDVVWYIISLKTTWIGTKNHPNHVNSYIRLTLILNIVVDFGKLVLFILLASEYNVDESEKKVVSVFGIWQVELSHDQVQKNFFSVLNKGDHAQSVQDQHY